MMKKTLTTLGILICLSPLMAQHQFSGLTDTDYPSISIFQQITDANGLTYVLLQLGSTDPFFPDPQNNSISVQNDNSPTEVMAVVVYNSDGTYNRHIKYELQGIDTHPKMAVNSSGDVFIVGSYVGSAYFDPQNPTVRASSQSTSVNFYLIGYDANGNQLIENFTSSQTKSTLAYNGGVSVDNSGITIAMLNDQTIALSVVLNAVTDMSFGATSQQFFGNANTRSTYLGTYDTGGNFISGIELGSNVIFESSDINTYEELYLFGYVNQGTADLDYSAASQTIQKVSKARNFVVRYDAGLNYLGHMDFGEGNISATRRISIDPNDSVVIASSSVWSDLYPDNTRDTLDLDNSPTSKFQVITDEVRGVFTGRYSKDLVFGGGSIMGGTGTDLLVNQIETTDDRIYYSLTYNSSPSTELNLSGDDRYKFYVPGRFNAIYSVSRDNRPLGLEDFDTNTLEYFGLDASENLYFTGVAIASKDLDPGSAVANLSGDSFYLGRLDQCMGTTSVQNPLLCFGDIYPIGSNSYFSDVEDYRLLESSTGCDSLAITKLVFPASAVSLSLDAQTDASCFGTSDGALTVSASGGNSGYSYSIDGTNYSTSGSFGNLSGGTYTVWAKDANECAASISVTIASPPQIQATVLTTSPTCFGDTDGSIELTNVSGGAGGYTYSIDGTNFQSGPQFSSLASGSYTIVVSDANNCTENIVISLTEPAQISIGSTITPVSCNGSTDGSIVVNASGGTAPLEYSLDNGNNFQTGNTFDNLAAGSYTITVRDANGCSRFTQGVVQEPAALAASIINVVPISCFGANDGAITLAVSGGTAPFEVSADGGAYNALPPNSQFTGIGPVTIQNLTIRDANGCTVTINGFTMPEPDAITADGLNIQHVSCNGLQDGQLEIAGTSGGTGSILYSLDGVNFQSSEVFTGLTASSYTLTMKDGNDCTATTTFTITQPDPLDLDAAIVDISCNGESDGSITGITQGGTGPYEYALDGTNFQLGAFTGLAAGNYTLTVKDGNGCITTSTVSVAEPAMLTVAVNSTRDVSCNAGSDGMVSLDVNGGTAPYEYSTDGQTFADETLLSSLAAGAYTLVVRDNRGCEATVQFNIGEPTAIAATASVTEASCHGNADGSLSVSATGGTGTLRYSVDGINFQSSSSFTGLGAGSYSITVQDDNQCTYSLNATITQPDALNLSFEAVDISCKGEGDGQIAGFTTGGTAPYAYSLDGTNFQSGAFSDLAPGSYTLTVKDNNECTASVSVTIQEPQQLTATVSEITGVSCFGSNDGSAVLSVAGGSTPYRYSLDGNTYGPSVVLTDLSPGNYTVYILDANDCDATSTFSITEPTAISGTTTIVDVLCHGDASGSIEVIASGGTGTLAYALDGTTFQAGSTFGNLTAGNYTVTVRDANGCTLALTAVVAAPDALTLTASLNNGNNITAVATGGTAPYEYSLDGSNFQTSGTFSNLANGNYTVTVRDANGCTTTASQTLLITALENEPADIIVSAYPNPVKDFLIISELKPGDEIIMTDTRGVLLESQAVAEHKTDFVYPVSHLREGLFILFIQDIRGQIRYTKKLLKVH
jgi:hypothetical protein